MGAPKVFVSSTCYDLTVLRSELRSYIEFFGFEPVMSEYSDVLFDYRRHTHSSCIQEVSYCDMIILIIGSRFGGTSVPSALSLVDIENLKEKGISKEILKEKENLSITQLEYLKGVETGIPIFPFVSTGVMNDHYTWETNKNNHQVNNIIYPNIEKQDTAKYIFEFINYIRLRHEGNSIFTFSKLDDIKINLRKQWAALFQRLLMEQRDKAQRDKPISDLAKQVADLQTVVFSSISNKELIDNAKGINKFRDLIIFLSKIYRRSDLLNLVEVLKKEVDWEKLMDIFNVDAIVNLSDIQNKNLHGTVLILKDGSYFQTRYDVNDIYEFIKKWNDFHHIKESSKITIINAILDDLKDQIYLPYIIYRDENYLETLSLEVNDIERTIELKVIWQSKKFVKDYKPINNVIFVLLISSKVG